LDRKKRLGEFEKAQKAAAERPGHFDISVLQKCFKRLVACTGEMRSQARKLLLKDIGRTMKVFLDDDQEQSFKKCVAVHELAGKLAAEGCEVDPVLAENLGAILLCFGEIEHDMRYGDRIPPETEEEKKERKARARGARDLDEARKEAEAAGEKFDERAF
jgi:hypothetical protein